MRPLLAAALFLFAVAASASDENPDCTASGYNKTLDACGADGANAGSRRCRRRLASVIAICKVKAVQRGEDPAVVNERIKTLAAILAVQEKLPPGEPGGPEDKPPRAEGGRRGAGDHAPGTAAQWLDEARQALQAGQPQKALALAQRALDAAPGDLDALRLHAQASLAQGDKGQAAADARRILGLAPDDEFARVVLGNTEGLTRDSGKIKGMKLEFEPKDDEGTGGPGRAAGGGEPPAGQGEPRPAGGAAPPATKAQVWQAAQTRFQLGDWTGALMDATRLIQFDPKDPRGWVLRARVSNRLKNWAAAEADARKALLLAPDDPAALLELGYAELQQGRAAEALPHIERALALDPRNGLGHLYRAQALEALGRRREAVEEYRSAAALDPALKPLADAALARLAPGRAMPAPAAPPPWRLPLRTATGTAAGALLLLGLRSLWAARRRDTTRPAPAPAEASEETPVPGTVLGGQFRVERELARGGMGVVLEATDTVLRRPVAIKRLRRDVTGSAEVRAKFLQEAQLAARLKHPNLAQILSVFGDGQLNLVFELVEGESLDALLARHARLPLDRVRAIVRQVCAALAHAHAHRVIHRDLKPGNVMVARDGTCKVMDFGIAHEARAASGATQTQAWGTPPYMAPEQEEGSVSPASDLYALAVTAYELLAGRRPFEGPGLSALKRAKRFEPLGGRWGLPRDIDAFFARALEPDPAARFASAPEFLAALEAVSDTPVRG